MCRWNVVNEIHFDTGLLEAGGAQCVDQALTGVDAP
jgi:hypothetical protein